MEQVVFVVISYLAFVNSIQAPSLVAFPDLYQVLEDGSVIQQRYSSIIKRHWRKQVKLKRLEVLSNDLSFNLPFATCVNERRTRKLAHVDKGGQKSRFEEISQSAGFHHVHRPRMAVRPHCVFDVLVPFHNSSKFARIPGEYCIPEHLTGGAAVADYDGDGLEDIYFTVFHDKSVLYKNNGDGTFTDVTKDTGIGPKSFANGAVWVDIDQDGDMDLYVTTVGDTRHYLYVNYGGYFQEEALERNCSMQTNDKRKLSGMTPNVGDFNLDGFPDIYVTEWLPHTLGKPSTSRLLQNKGNQNLHSSGYFEDVTITAGVNMDEAYKSDEGRMNDGTYSFGSSFTDFDNDGYQELLVTADFGSSKMFWNTKQNSFTECTNACGLKAKQDAMGHAIGDWDNNGLLDWFSSAIWHNRTECSVTGCTFDNKGNVLFHNLGGRRFEDVTDRVGVANGGWGWGASFIDFDNDGFLDFIETSGIDFPTTTTDDYFREKSMHLWKNLGAGHNGTTVEVSSLYGLNRTGQGRGLLKWDFDDDGDEDIVVSNNIGAPFFYQNHQREPNNWIRIRVVHRCLANMDKLCDSLGARVQVILGNNQTQTQEIGSSTHFLGQSSLSAHFGLGRDSGNVTVKVTWPSASLHVTYIDVPPYTRLKVVRPSPSDSGKTFPFSSLDKCFSLKILKIGMQPSHAAVSINPDGQTLNFQVNHEVSAEDLDLQRFSYTMTVEPNPGPKPITSNITSFVTFDYQPKDTSPNECTDGKNAGPLPSVTDSRRLDGTSYNKENVFWGSAMENVARDLPAVYADGVAMPAGTCSPEQKQSGNCRYVDAVSGFGSQRPSPRTISNELFRQIEPAISARRLSDLHTHFGQFLSHDTDFSSPLPRYEFEGFLTNVWLPIKVPKGDVHFDPLNKGNIYLPFVRSTYNRCTGRESNTPRQQINKITSYIDGSMVYGESRDRNNKLREFKDGKLKLGPGDLIPDNTMALANDNPVGRDADSLLAAGDSRANVQPGLIALHTLFAREHNRLCDVYKKKYPQATDEQLFQAARRLVAAELQAITFREYLPALLGGTKHIPPYQGYNNSIDVGISNIMTTAAFRFGHSQVNTHLWRYEEDGTMSPYGHLPLRDAYFAPERVKREGGIDPLIRGAVRQAAQEIDLMMVDDMRNLLFPSGRGQRLGMDLAALNIQRGREHGLPDYNSVRKAFDLPGILSFSNITKDSSVVRKMEELYHGSDNIDLWVGGLAEDHEEGSELGPTFRKIVMLNLLRIRDGDRFWYEHHLTKEEIDMVHSLTLGKIIRLNTGFKSAPDHVFFSSQYCEGVKDFQCVPRDNSTVENFQEKTTKQKHSCIRNSAVIAENNNNSCDALIPVLVATCGVFFFIAVVLFFICLKLWLHFRWHKAKDNALAGNQSQFELSYQNKNRIESAESL